MGGVSLSILQSFSPSKMRVKTTQKLLRLVLIYVLDWHMNGQMDRRCNDTNADKAYYLLVVYEWLFSVSIV